MTVDELGQRTKAKHPEYGSMSDSEVGVRVLSKYPEYRNQIGPVSNTSMPVDENVGNGGIASGLRSMAHAFPPLDAISTVSELIDPAAKMRAMFPKAGGALAEKLGGMTADPRGGPGLDPRFSAAAALPVAIAPELASAGLSLAEVLGLGKMGQGAISKAIRMVPEELGKQYATQDVAAGIQKQLPIQRGASARFPSGLSRGIEPEVAAESLSMTPRTYPKDPNTFVNFATKRVEAFGDKLTPQELNDTKTILNTMMKDGKLAPGTPPYALASGLKKQITELANKAIPGRAELNKVYALSKTFHPDMGLWVKEGVKKYGTKAIGAVLAGLGIGAGTQLFK